MALLLLAVGIFFQKRANTIILAACAGVFALLLWLVRSQARVGVFLGLGR